MLECLSHTGDGDYSSLINPSKISCGIGHRYIYKYIGQGKIGQCAGNGYWPGYGRKTGAGGSRFYLDGLMHFVDSLMAYELIS